jgi:DNA-binding winged helix-turn-helix (wHTH) protein/Tol biopolymer transport system component
MSRQKRRIYEFDNFRLDVGERRLLRDGKAVALSAKAFDLLLVLIENNGHLIEKDVLYNRVWRDQMVEESNLTVQMSAIRKALGDHGGKRQYIGTVIGSGYRFTADVREVDSRTDEDLIIESELVERVIIEKEEEIAGVAENNGAKYIETNETSSAAQPFTESRNRKPVLIITVLVLFSLAAAFGGYLLYRGRSKASVSPMPTSRGQMTITRLTDGRSLGASAISPDGKFVAYIENSVAGAGTLFVQQIDTNTVLKLLEPDSRTFGCVNFSPDGSLIYYVAFDKRDPYGALYSVPVLGGMPKRITGNLGSCFAVSPDGKRAALYRKDPESNQINLMIAALDGNGEQTLLPYALNQWSFGFGLAWSPDGSSIAVSADAEPNDLVGDFKIFGVDVSSGAIKPLTSESFSGVGKISWTSDGRNLVFVARRPRGENELFSIDYLSGEARQITNDLESYGNYGLGVTADSDMLVADEIGDLARRGRRRHEQSRPCQTRNNRWTIRNHGSC